MHGQKIIIENIAGTIDKNWNWIRDGKSLSILNVMVLTTVLDYVRNTCEFLGVELLIGMVSAILVHTGQGMCVSVYMHLEGNRIIKQVGGS